MNACQVWGQQPREVQALPKKCKMKKPLWKSRSDEARKESCMEAAALKQDAVQSNKPWRSQLLYELKTDHAVSLSMILPG